MRTIVQGCRETGRVRHILVLRGTHAGQTASDLFETQDNVEYVDTFDAALEHLRSASYDLVVIEDAEFMAFERSALASQSAVLLETIGHGLGILALTGRFQWCNGKFDQIANDVKDKLKARCLELFSSDIAAGRSRGQARRFSIATDDGRQYEVTASPVLDSDEKFAQIAVVVLDATSSRRLQQKMNAIERAGEEFIALESEAVGKLDIPGRLALLEEKITNCTRDILGFDKFCIRLLDKRTNRLELVLSSGLSEEGRGVEIFASAEGEGISGYVVATKRSYICPDVSRDERYLAGIDQAGSSLTVPLFFHDDVVGVFNIESERVGAFGEEDRQFAEIFGRYVARALRILDLLVVERHDATGQLADNVSSGVSGPLNDILTDVSTLTEEYIGRDDLRAKLEAISRNVGKVREVLKQAAQGPNGILDHHKAKPMKDTVLSGKTILVVDDEPIIRETINEVLSGTGAAVDMAREGNEALAMLGERRYDLVLTDIKMPHKSGYDIFAKAKDVDADLPVIFMTGFGYDQNHSIIRARQEGLSGVLYKPFKVSDFLGLVKDVLREAAGEPKVS